MDQFNNVPESCEQNFSLIFSTNQNAENERIVYLLDQICL